MFLIKKQKQTYNIYLIFDNESLHYFTEDIGHFIYAQFI